MNRSYVGTWQSYKNPTTVKRCMWGDNRLPFRFDFDIGAGEIAILKESGEVVETDWADDEHIVSYVAKDQQAYLELLFALEQNSQSAIFSDKSKWSIEHLANIAGGNKYKENLLDLLS